MRFVRPVSSFIAVVIVLIVLGSTASTHFVLRALGELGIAIPLSDRVSMTLADIVGIAPLYGAIFGLALIIAFIAAAFVTRLAPSLRWLVYLVAGGSAIGTALVVLVIAFDGIVPIAGARSTGGVITQVIVGAFVGYLFARFTPPKEA